MDNHTFDIIANDTNLLPDRVQDAILLTSGS